LKTFNKNHNKTIFPIKEQKFGLLVSKLDLGCELKSHPILDENGVKAMPGSIPAPNP